MVFAEEKAPFVVPREAKERVAGEVAGFEQEAEVGEAARQTVGHVLGVAAVEGQAEGGVRGAERPGGAGQDPHGGGLTRGDGELAAQGLALGDLGAGAFGQAQDLLGADAEEAAFLGEGDGARAALEEAATQFLLQFPKLFGEGWLGDEETLGGAGDVSLAGDGEEVAEDAQFHRGIPFGYGRHDNKVLAFG